MIRKLLRKMVWLPWVVPGFLLWASFPPMAEHTDCLFALAPLMWFARRRPARRSFLLWAANGLFFWLATLSWMPAIVKNGGPWPLVALGWGALAAYCALYFGAFGWLSAGFWGWAREGGYWRRLAGLVVVEPVLWAGLELVRSRLFGGFAWNQLGVAPVNAGFGAPAAIGGVYLVSACVVLVNGTVASIAERMLAPFLKESSPVPNWARSVETLIPLAVVWGVYSLGASGCAGPAEGRGESAALPVALVQRDFPCVFSAASAREDPVKAYVELAERTAPVRPAVVVLPESALGESGPVDQQGALAVADRVLAASGASAMLAGGTRFGDGELFNSAALYVRGKSGAELAGCYDKVHLVPFGEFIPFDKAIPALQRLAPVGSCTPGALKTLALPDGTAVGVAICFEDTDSAQMRALARMGARILFFVTNDSWFSESDEAVQHSWQATARAIETGLPVVRVGNNGVTGTILPDGRASWLRGPDGNPLVDARATMCDRVPLGGPSAGRTWYVRLGDVPLAAAFLLLIIGMIVVKYKNEHEKRRYLSM